MADIDVNALVEQVPPLSGGKMVGPKWADAHKVFDPIMAGGRDAVVAVIAMLKEADDGSDYKARYVLGGLAACAAAPDADAKQRPTLIDALTSQLGGDRPRAVQQFLVRLLVRLADKSAAPALGKLLEDAALANDAAAALTAIGPDALAALRDALPKAKGVARLAVLQALGTLKDADSLPAFKQAAGDADREVRVAAVRALAELADPACVDLLIKASGSEGWERIESTKACLVMAEKLLAAGRKDDAARLCKHLRDTRTDKSEAYVVEAASSVMP